VYGWNSKIIGLAGLATVAALGWVLYGELHSWSAAAQTRDGASSPVIPVTAGTATARDMPVYVHGLGSVQAYNNVTVKSRVDGAIVKVDFTEGQEVKAGDNLFEVDPRPYQAALAQAQANLARDQAQFVNAQLNVTRDKPLLSKDFVSHQQFDTDSATAATAGGTVQADQAQIQSAQLNLDYATIRSPIDGRTGARQVDIGNLVHATDNTPLVTITQIKPIFVSFTAPQSQFDAIREAQSRGPVEVQAWSQGTQKQLAQGKLTLIDNQIDQATGTIHMKASFDNQDEALWPGAFVDVRLVVDTLTNAVTVPARTVQAGPNGSFLYVIKSDNTVEMRIVQVSEVENDVAVISNNLAAGERVVVDGQYRLDQGAKISIQSPQAQPGSANGGT
jgi:multidrug efflux system membrane fusion protein